MYRRACQTIAIVLMVLNFSPMALTAFGQGRLLWDIQQDFDGGTDIVRDITLSKKTAVVVGNGGPEDDFIIEALGKASGAVQWSEHVPAFPGVSTGVQVTRFQGIVFASGYTTGPAVSSTDISVRAYDASTGALLWSNVWDAGRDDSPQAIAANRAAVVVVGQGGNVVPGEPIHLLVRAYEPATGAVLWEDRLNDVESAAWGVTLNRNRVFVAGTTFPSPSSRDLLLRAYDISTGHLEWEVARPSVSPVEVKFGAGHLFVAGSEATNASPYLAAFDAKTGALVWDDTVPASGSGLFSDVRVKGERVVAVGRSGRSLVVRAYDALTGVLQWEDAPAVDPGFFEFASAVDFNTDAVYVAATSEKAFEYAEIVVRAYSAADGALLWDDRSHRSAMSAALAVALGRNRLFVGGFATGSRFDFVVRAYDIRPDRALASD